MITDSVTLVVARYLAMEEDKTSWNLVGLRDYYLGWVLDQKDLLTLITCAHSGADRFYVMCERVDNLSTD